MLLRFGFCLILLFIESIIAQENGFSKLKNARCSALQDCSVNGDCLECQFPSECKLNEDIVANCTTLPNCVLRQSLTKAAKCRFCWQSDPWEHTCDPVANCSSTSTQLVPTRCTIHWDVICMGKRHFYKNVKCNWTSGHSWAKALFLSVVLGGFGVDRFYLGLWKSGIGKLFSFGGLGVWTIIDVILIATGYIRPHDGSHYV
ncbi:unnamed protein product, partial [Mesorhabditis belari]|uniref:TM2 domain-containing protein n=1 Tax=Mesorhabditis belari TaxID=2138241 RepID=A0AAF3J7K0_9BILA